VQLLTGLSPKAVDGASRSGDWWVGDRLRDEAVSALERRLVAFHDAEPLAPGEELASLRPAVSRVLRSAGRPSDADLAEAVIEAMIDGGRLAREGTTVRLSSHAVPTTSAEQERLVEAVRGGEPTPPTVSELQTAGFERSLIDAVVRSGALARIAPDLLLTSGFVQRAEDIVREAGQSGITVSAVRERLGTSRKYAVPLMEHLDRTGVTRRSGDLRFARRL
jgi:selenocysteine-specific elongation factor